MEGRLAHRAKRGQPIRRQLHDLDALIMEILQAAEDQSGRKSNQKADPIQRSHDERFLAAKEACRKHQIQREPGAAGHEGDKQRGHAAALFAFQCPGGHDARHIAAKAQHHGDQRLAAEMKIRHHFIGQKSDARHISAFLQEGEPEIQAAHQRDEADHAGRAAHHALQQEALDHFRYAFHIV